MSQDGIIPDDFGVALRHGRMAMPESAGQVGRLFGPTGSPAKGGVFFAGDDKSVASPSGKLGRRESRMAYRQNWRPDLNRLNTS